MQPPKPGTEYAQGQMMGMLVIIQMLEAAEDTKVPIDSKRLQTIKNVAVNSLSEYLQKPGEDVILLVDKVLKSI